MVARESGVSATWVAQAKKGTAHKLGEETAAKINAALDRLGEMANPSPAVHQRHPGVEALANDARLRSRHGITDAEIAALRLVTYQPSPIQTVLGALHLLAMIRAEEPLE